MSQAFSHNTNSFNTWNCTGTDDDSKILAWLSPLEPWVRHRDIGAQRVDSIGGWLLETEEFRRWHKGRRGDESNHATLLRDGNPGVGKSYIISLVIDKLCDETVEGDTTVTCFYFDFAARNEQSPINMLGSLLRQLVSGLERIPEVVVQGFRNQKKAIGGRGLQVSGILKMFQAIAARNRVFICVDAIDECAPEHRMVVLESLGQILQGSPNAHLFMTGRPHVRHEVEIKLDREAAFVLIQPTKDGFVAYLREKLRTDTTLDVMSNTLEADIMKIIPELSSETFLLASLHIQAILRETTIARRGKRLKSLKDGVGLGGAYGATLERIKTQDEEKTKLAIATLTWICHSERPLQVDELCHALAVEIGTTDFDPDNVPSISTLLGCCQGLITVDKEASTVRLIHFTVQEYLCAQPELFSRPHSIIAEACLTYLNSQQVKNLPPHPLPDHKSTPFLKYSSRYWGTHGKRELSNHARVLTQQLLENYEDHVSAVSLLSQVVDSSSTGGINTPQFSGLHCASFFGIGEFVTALANAKGCEIDQRDCIGCTPLSWAAENGHEEAVKILLSQENVKPNDPNGPDNQNITPLLWAAYNGHEGVVKLLLDRKDVDPNRPDNQNCTPLLRAAYSGHEGIAKLLLDRKDVDPNRPDDENDQTPLGHAAEKGHKGVVELLLERDDVDPNRPNKWDNTPLSGAANNGHEGVVKLLLDRKDVDPNRPDNRNITPLSWAAYNRHEGVVKLLLDRKDVDPNRPDGENDRTPIGHAAERGHKGVVELLLGRDDVDPNRPNKWDNTPLSGAANNGHEGVVKLLLDRKDVDPNRLGNQNTTPLFWAAYNGHEGVVKLLLGRKDVDPNRPDGENDQTPLGHAAEKGHKGVVELLLGRGDVDPDRPDKWGSTPLSRAVNNGHEGVAKILLDRKDVDPNRADVNGQTPLSCAAEVGYEGVVKLLLTREDVDPDRPDNLGGTPLSWAANNGHEGIAKVLLDQKDADPNRADVNGQTPPSCAAEEGREGAVKLLPGRQGVDPERLDSQTGTSPSRVANSGHEGGKPLLGQEDVAPDRPGECSAVEEYEGVIKPPSERGHVDSNNPKENDGKPLEPTTVGGHEGVALSSAEQYNAAPTLPDVNDQTRCCGRCVLL